MTQLTPSHLEALQEGCKATDPQVLSQAVKAAYEHIKGQPAPSSHWWNKFLDELDSDYPEWRGYPSPRVIFAPYRNVA